jgi:hypothetical protein
LVEVLILSHIISYILRILISFLLSLCFVSLQAQSYEGKWLGKVKNANGAFDAELILKNNTVKTQISGTFSVQNKGLNDEYILEGKLNNKTVSGILKYHDGTIFPFELILLGEVMTHKIYYNGQVILQGSYEEVGRIASAQIEKKDGLFRDPALVGHWTFHENYSSSGGFYGGSSSSIVLFADGRIGDGGSKSFASGPNSSGNSSGTGNSTIEKVRASGARWFTKGNLFYWRVNVNGHTKDVANSKYFIKDGALLLTDIQTGKKLLYYRK